MQTKIHPSKKCSAISIIILIIIAGLSSFIAYTYVTGSVNDPGSNPADDTGIDTTSNSGPNQQQTSLFASFSYTAPIVNYNIRFIDTSQAGSASITQWSWSFGDSATSTEQNPRHAYSTTGVKTVSLTVIDSDGKTSTTTKMIFVESLRGFTAPLMRLLPFADFSVSTTNPTVNQQVDFTDKSVSYFGEINSWLWSFGDGTTSIEQNPTHTYSTAGVKTVTLAVTDSLGIASAVTKTLSVAAEVIQIESPTAEFTVSSVNPTVLQEVTFTDTSITGSGVINQWLWSFGDESTSTQQNPTHAYTTTGVKTITLTVTDSNGKSSTTTKTITVEEAPIAEFTVSSVNPLVLQQVSFTDTSVAGSGAINNWLWDFGDGVTSTEQNPTHAYSTIGLKTVTLTVTDSNGKTSTVTHELTVNDYTSPTANFTYSPSIPLVGENVSFTCTTLHGSGWVNQFLWDFGDGTTSNEHHPTHVYSTPGLKTVTFTVTDEYGKTSIATQELTVIDLSTKSLFWSGTAWSASDMRALYGSNVTSPVLEADKIYYIEVSEIFWYNASASLAADAMYYTTDGSNSWDWSNYHVAPDGHSFLQMDGKDINWGAFSNGATLHTYSIIYVGQGKALTFEIVDWMDGNYDNNYCHLPITIYSVGTTAPI
ncbi:MAG: PKD domain-containing protein [Candidatus Bathyarchaeota archaeon]|nr:PKD domain-containing protein [Candidatus Bathyarchaeota archaeon]